jgi:hypothetical protein
MSVMSFSYYGICLFERPRINVVFLFRSCRWKVLNNGLKGSWGVNSPVKGIPVGVEEGTAGESIVAAEGLAGYDRLRVPLEGVMLLCGEERGHIIYQMTVQAPWVHSLSLRYGLAMSIVRHAVLVQYLLRFKYPPISQTMCRCIHFHTAGERYHLVFHSSK